MTETQLISSLCVCVDGEGRQKAGREMQTARGAVHHTHYPRRGRRSPATGNFRPVRQGIHQPAAAEAGLYRCLCVPGRSQATDTVLKWELDARRRRQPAGRPVCCRLVINQPVFRYQAGEPALGYGRLPLASSIVFAAAEAAALRHPIT